MDVVLLSVGAGVVVAIALTFIRRKWGRGNDDASADAWGSDGGGDGGD
jgi:hypothetical protein